MSKRNPPWLEEELILALDLYMTMKERGIKSGRIPEMKQLADTLNKLAPFIHDQDVERNEGSVYNKILNIVSLDDENSSGGRPNGSKLDKKVWDMFKDRPDELGNYANTIRKIIKDGENPKTSQLESEEEFYEGKLFYKIHKQRERNHKLVSIVKEEAMLIGKLICEVCGFDFKEEYGDLGEGYIECHHKIPISTYNGTQKTRKEDLALVCSNCHRMLHKQCLSIEDLKQIVRENNNK